MNEQEKKEIEADFKSAQEALLTAADSFDANPDFQWTGAQVASALRRSTSNLDKVAGEFKP